MQAICKLLNHLLLVTKDFWTQVDCRNENKLDDVTTSFYSSIKIDRWSWGL